MKKMVFLTLTLVYFMISIVTARSSDLLKPFWDEMYEIKSEGVPINSNVKIFLNQEIPYCIFRDSQHDRKYSMMKYIDNKWIYAGPVGFLERDMTVLGAEASSDGRVFLAYCKPGLDYKPKFVRFDGKMWTEAGLKEVLAQCESCEPLFNKLIYRCFVDPKNMDRITINKLVNAEWICIGILGQLKSGVGFSDVKIYGNSLYMYYYDELTLTSLVMKYDGDKWNPVGSGNEGVEYLEINNGIPYIVCSFDGDAKVMRFKKNKWEQVGDVIDFGEMKWPGSFLRLIFNNDNIYFTANDQFNHGSGMLIKKYNGRKWQYCGQVIQEYRNHIGISDFYKSDNTMYLSFWYNGADDPDGKGMGGNYYFFKKKL
jgi:hypothetical protein